MKIIDAHMHFSDIESFKETAKDLSKLDYSYEGIMKEYKDANVVLGIGMGLEESEKEGFPDPSSRTPMGLDLAAQIPPSVVYCAGVNPHHLDEDSIAALEKAVQDPKVVGIKIYLGYYRYYAHDKVYDPVYKIASKYGLPVVFHTGDTYSERGLLKYSHPLTLDEVAVEHRDINFVMAHFGDPWTLDGAEVVYKNRNMYADLSGLVVGTGDDLRRYKESPRFFNHLKHALTFTDNYKKFLFGTDWPLIPIQPYIEFVKSIIPKEYHEDVFYNTALNVFPKIKQHL
ncbi:amidohydrolase family protein [Pseudalkalibacillus berkeleyi]|uniref:Amidohydrolase family protein n=1 Tax=Pseudalkalibacillus berkeleyi TaxID=1069813 RepID=A0ABS9GZT2_9BACL|nr:TatD family hydrolase [Pseudalkalibacillus berkeleyi]MCF6138257.1 amidohydrolase family protein [Pseudalkalibacillus berkeleyi]